MKEQRQHFDCWSVWNRKGKTRVWTCVFSDRWKTTFWCVWEVCWMARCCRLTASVFSWTLSSCRLGWVPVHQSDLVFLLWLLTSDLNTTTTTPPTFSLISIPWRVFSIYYFKSSADCFSKYPTRTFTKHLIEFRLIKFTFVWNHVQNVSPVNSSKWNCLFWFRSWNGLIKPDSAPSFWALFASKPLS